LGQAESGHPIERRVFHSGAPVGCRTRQLNSSNPQQYLADVSPALTIIRHGALPNSCSGTGNRRATV
jgi:hypothetical protein